jgi:hypothetical protein
VCIEIMDNNKKLFTYAVDELNSHGGDGTVCIVFKQQKVADVAKEFEAWQRENCPPPHLFRGGMGFLNEAYYTDGSNESLKFIEWTDYDRYLRGEVSECSYVQEQVLHHWDAVIVTW